MINLRWLRPLSSKLSRKGLGRAGNPTGAILLILITHAPGANAQTGAFTYQGRLVEGSNPANGSYDLQFGLADAVTNGNHVGITLTKAPLAVSNGLFSVTLDFGSALFDGSGRWLEIAVRTNGSTGPYTVLAPRQPITASPYVLRANTAAYAEVASSVASGGWKTNELVWMSLAVDGPQFRYDWVSLSNGVVALPAWNSDRVGDSPGLRFFNTNGMA